MRRISENHLSNFIVLSFIKSLIIGCVVFSLAPAADAQGSDECLLIIASRETLDEAHAFVGSPDGELGTEIYRAPNGYFAISAGWAPRQLQLRNLDTLIAENKIPKDAFCSKAKDFDLVHIVEVKPTASIFDKIAILLETNSPELDTQYLVWVLVVVVTGLTGLIGFKILKILTFDRLIVSSAVLGLIIAVISSLTSQDTSTKPDVDREIASLGSAKPLDTFSVEFCNKHGAKVFVALDRKINSYEEFWTVEGWWTIEPNACRMLLRGEFGTYSDTIFYYYAESADNFEWSGDGQNNRCIPDSKFSRVVTANYTCKSNEELESFREITVTRDNPDRILDLK